MKNVFKLFLFTIMISCNIQDAPEGQKVKISTEQGDIYLVLYDDTPIHKQNFIDNINNGAYIGADFHRVIADFMIQGGPKNKKKEGSLLTAEIIFPKHIHKRGALAAARKDDDVNPDKMSDPYEFYIVTGDSVKQEDLILLEKERFEKLKQRIYKGLQVKMNDSIKQLYKEGRKDEIMRLRAKTLDETGVLAKARKSEVNYSDEQIQTYLKVGGTPHLDTEYTVFGEVYAGMDVVQKISKAETNQLDKPKKEIIIKEIKLLN